MSDRQRHDVIVVGSGSGGSVVANRLSEMEGLRVELKPHGIVVTTICPGWIRTPLAQIVPVPQKQMMEPAFAADRIVDAVHRRRAYYAFPIGMTNQVRLLKWLPSGISDWLTMRAARGYQIS